MRALLVLAAALALTGLAVTDRARACSCAAPEPREALATADAAVVGTIVDDGDPATLRVDEVVKGDVPGEIELTNDGDSAACGTSYAEGDELGLFLRRKGDGWEAGLCDSVDPDDLRRAARALPEPRGSGTAALIALPVGDFAGLGAMLLDADGEILSYAYGDGWHRASVCPGSTHVVGLVGEGRRARFVTRRLRDLRVVRRRSAPREEVFEWACRDRRGRSVAVVAGLFEEPAVLRARLLVLGDGRARTLRRAKIASATFIGDTAYLDEGKWGQDLVSVDLRTGAARSIARVPYVPQRWSLSRDRRHLATTAFGRELGDTSIVVVVDLRTGAVRTRPGSGSALWVGRDRLLNDGKGVLDARLRMLRPTGRSVAESELVRTGGRVYGLDYGELSEVDPATARPRRIATLPGDAMRRLIAIPEGAEVAVKRGAPELLARERRWIRAAVRCGRLLW